MHITVALIGLGSNVGAREQLLQQAVLSLQMHKQIQNVVCSKFYETEAIGSPLRAPLFLNAAVKIETDLSAQALLAVMQTIEKAAGRTRHAVWEPRTLDLDLLLYGESCIQEQNLIVPHAFLPFRRFVLEPAAEIAATQIVPLTSGHVVTVQQLLDNLNHSSHCFECICANAELREYLQDAWQKNPLVSFMPVEFSASLLHTNNVEHGKLKCRFMCELPPRESLTPWPLTFNLSAKRELAVLHMHAVMLSMQ